MDDLLEPTVFIGSSKKGLSIAHAIEECLNDIASINVWDNAFDEYINRSTLDCLIELRDIVDFAIFVLTPDDRIKIRGKNKVVSRDNIMFELGLFFSKLGRDRCFYLWPTNKRNFQLPSDLFGINTITYDYIRGNKRGKKEEDFKHAISSACQKIRKSIDEKSIDEKRFAATFYDSCTDAPGFQELLENAEEDFFSIGPSLQFVAQNQKDTVFRCAEEKGNLSIKLMIMGDDPKAAELINEYASGSNFLPERQHSQELFLDWQEEAKAKGLNISIKVAPGIIPMSVNISDSQSPVGKMLVIPFPYKTSGTDRPCFLVNKIGNPECIDRYTEKFNLIWSQAKDITSN